MSALRSLHIAKLITAATELAAGAAPIEKGGDQ
jgi:hypothetical protein